MQTAPTTLTTQQMATLAANLLNQHLLEAGRTQAKRLYRTLIDGAYTPLQKLSTKEGGLIRVDLKLEASAFEGALNFSAFRDSVAALLVQMTEAAKVGADFSTFSPLAEASRGSAAETGERLLAFGGLTQHGDNTNLLMLGIRADPQEPVLQLRLMYIDPRQFQSDTSTVVV